MERDAHNDPNALARRIAAVAEWSYSRSSGPGGQRRDHAETRATLTVTSQHLGVLPPGLGTRVGAGLRLGERPLRLSSQTQRERERNREIVIGRLAARIAAALAPPPPARRPTRPSRAARERRLAEKSHRARIKADRGPPAAD